MATALSQSDTDTTFSNCSITYLLPRTLGSSVSAGASSFDSDDLGYVSSLFSSTALNNPTKLLEHAKMISNSDCSRIPNASLDDRNNLLGKRSHGDLIELQDKRSRQRRPGLRGVERVGNVFNFSVKETAVEASQMGMDGFSKRSHCFESNSQSWPVIDYSCLEHISDPMEYFSTYRKLENAEKELKKLKGEASPKLSQPHGRRDRRRRPGLPDNEGGKKVFKFPSMTGTVEDSQIENFTQSNGASITELAMASCSKEISQIENSQAVEPESKLTGKSETCDKEIDELERLLSKCRELDNDGIASFLRETLQINPIHVEKSSGLPFSAATPQLSQISPVSSRNKTDRLSNLKRRFSFIIQPGDPFLPHKSVQEEQSDGSAELGSNCKVLCDAGLEKFPSSERGKQMEDLEKLKSNGNDISVDGMAELEQETLKTKLLDAKTTNSIDHLTAIKKSNSLIDIQGRLAKLSTLKRHIMQNTTEGEYLMFSHDDLEESSLSERREMRSCSPVGVTHFDRDSMDAQNACIPGFSNLKRSSFVDKMHSPVTEASEEDLGRRKTSDPIGCQVTLLEDTCQEQNGTISVEEFASIVSSASFEEVGQPSTSVDYKQPVNTNVPEQILHAEAPEDVSFPENAALIDVQLEAPCEALNGMNKNQGHSESSGGSPNQKSEREEPPRRRRKTNSILRRKSLAGAGSAWESGVRRSTRIRVKPLQYWCGERFLYGRVHDSLTTVIGIKKYETPPQKGRNTAMKVRSYVSEEYADLVAQAALH